MKDSYLEKLIKFAANYPEDYDNTYNICESIIGA